MLRKKIFNGIILALAGVTGILLITCVTGLVFAAEDTGDYILEDTVVTATKLGETNVQETPISITAIDTEQLTNRGVTSVNDLHLVTPSLRMTTETRFTILTIRGIGSTLDFYLGASDAVGVYADNTYLPRYMGLSNASMDIERVEVLRGPQGTLYGRNTSAGAIRIISQKPTDEFSGYITLEYGTDNKHGFQGALSGPINDKLKGRFAFLKEVDDGYFDNLGPGTSGKLNAMDKTAARAILQFTPSDKMDFMLRGEYLELDTDGGNIAGYLVQDDWVAAGADPWVPYESFATNHYEGQGTDNSGRVVSLDATFKLPHGMELLSTSSYTSFEWGGPKADWDGTTLEAAWATQNMKFNSVSQDLQLNGKWGKLSFVGGLFYIHEEEELDSYIGFVLPDLMQIDIFQTGEMDADSYAAYISGTYAVTDRFSVSAGVRYTHDRKKLHIDNAQGIDISGIIGVPYPFYVAYPAYMDTLEESWSDISPKLGVNYRLSDDIFLFASITKGFKAGGFDASVRESLPAYDPELVWNYEIGAKTDWLDNRFRANLTAFYMDYQDIQTKGFGIKSDGSFGSWIQNATDSDLYGAELEIIARPISTLTLGTNISYLNTKYGNLIFQDKYATPIDCSGNELQHAPEWTVKAYLTYVIPMGDYGFTNLNLNYSWQDTWYAEPLNEPEKQHDAYGLLNAEIRFETLDNKWFLSIYGRNITDERYTVVKFWLPGIGIPESYDNPMVMLGNDARRFGVKLGFKF